MSSDAYFVGGILCCLFGHPWIGALLIIASML